MFVYISPHFQRILLLELKAVLFVVMHEQFSKPTSECIVCIAISEQSSLNLEFCFKCESL